MAIIILCLWSPSPKHRHDHHHHRRDTLISIVASLVSRQLLLLQLSLPLSDKVKHYRAIALHTVKRQPYGSCKLPWWDWQPLYRVGCEVLVCFCRCMGLLRSLLLDWYLGSQKLRKILTLLCCITLSSSREKPTHAQEVAHITTCPAKTS